MDILEYIPNTDGGLVFYSWQGVIGEPTKHGIIPRIVNDIFNYIYGMDENLEFHIKVTVISLFTLYFPNPNPNLSSFDLQFDYIEYLEDIIY